MRATLRTFAGPTLLVLVGLAYLSIRAAPRISDGSDDLRRVHAVMSDEALILENVWAMVERGDLHHGVKVYPGLYPYTVALVDLASDAPAKTVVERTRWLSLLTTWLALLLPFVLLARLADSAWAAAVFTFFVAIHPETILWASRVHPDAYLLLFDHGALACFGLAVARNRRYLWAATILAGLSAGTKLFGCFIMGAIGLYILWDRRKAPRALLFELAQHSLLFIGVFVATTPMLLIDPKQTIDGFVTQHKRNRLPDATILDWWTTFVSPRGLGYAGVATVFVGGAVYAARRSIRGLGVIVFFALGYLVFIFATVRLTLPRYAAPATWPLLFVGIVALRPSLARVRALPVAVIVALLAVFAVYDWPRQRAALAMEDKRVDQIFDADRVALAAHLESIAERHPDRKILSAPFLWVPEGVPWQFVWSLEETQVPGAYAAVILEPYFEQDPTYALIRRGALPFVATATIGPYVVYERTDLN